MSEKPKVVDISPSMDIPECLRNLADNIEEGNLGAVENLTISFEGRVFHFGDVSDEISIKNAYWNLSTGASQIALQNPKKSRRG